MHGSCRTCKHWEKPALAGWLGDCLLLKTDEDGYSTHNRGAEPLASVSAQELPASLHTGPDFGCVLYAAAG